MAASPSTDMAKIAKIRDLLGITTSAVATEHFFTFSLSSLPTTKKFFGKGSDATPQDVADVRKSVLIATVLSLGTSAVISVLVGKPAPLLVSIGMSALFTVLYERALE